MSEIHPPELQHPSISFHGHNECETPINLRRSGVTPSTNIHLFKTDNNLHNKSIVSNASSIIPCSADSFVIINEDHIQSLIERTKYKPLNSIQEQTEKDVSSQESGQSKNSRLENEKKVSIGPVQKNFDGSVISNVIKGSVVSADQYAQIQNIEQSIMKRQRELEKLATSEDHL